MIYFGKVKNTEDWGFDFFTSTFETYKEVTEEIWEKIINQANKEGKKVSADKNGDPILIDIVLSKEEQTKIKIIENEMYLKETDWYVYRQAETGKPIPEDIKEQRERAREILSELKCGKSA